MWVRVVTTVPVTLEPLVGQLGRLDPHHLAALAEGASNDGCRLSAHLSSPVDRGMTKTLHLRWWNEGDRAQTPSIDGEIALRPQGDQATEVSLTARYRFRERLRELADSMFLRRVAESTVTVFLHALVEELRPALIA